MIRYNRRPIFINAFARGGSNLLVNLLISHPDVCISSGETHKVFKPGSRFDVRWTRIKKRLCYDYPIRLIVGQDFFNPHLIRPRKSVRAIVRRYIDYILYNGRFKAAVETHNLYKFENIQYTKEELANCRLLTKGLNGIVFTVDLFQEMYRDAVFFGLIRNGLAICEGRVRRGIAVESFAKEYNAVVDKMLECNKKIANYHMVKYEDMVVNPVDFIHQLYEKADLDIKQLRKVRLESKPVMNRLGQHQLLMGSDHQVFWYELNELQQHIKPDINANQIQQLSAEDRAKFLCLAGETMEKLGYKTD